MAGHTAVLLVSWLLWARGGTAKAWSSRSTSFVRHDWDPPADNGPSSEVTSADPLPEELLRLTDAGPKVAGRIGKAGILPLDKWDHSRQHEVKATFNQWLAGATGLRGAVSRTAPPPVAPCVVLVNHVYKFIFVKNTKAAGTSLFLYFGGGYCSGVVPGYPVRIAKGYHNNPTACVTPAGGESQKDLAAMWRDYFVFTVSRNPFSRAASSYDYILNLRPTRIGACADPTFDQFCQTPYMLGVQDRLFGCYADKNHNFGHTQPQSLCVATETGESAVDFVVRYENLSEDFMALIDILNSRRGSGVPPLKGSVGWAQKGPLAKAESHSDTQMSRSLLAEASAPASGVLGERTAETGSPRVAASGGATMHSGVELRGDASNWTEVHRSDLASDGGSPGRRSLLGSHASDLSRHADKYRKCGMSCIKGVAEYYKADFAFFGYATGS